MSDAPWSPPPLAGWWSRVLAALLDTLIMIGLMLVPVVVVISALVFTVESEDTVDTVTDAVFIPIYLLGLFLYFPLTMRRGGARNGQTWGKQAMKIRVMRADGLPVNAETAIVREILVKTLLFQTLAGCLLGIPWLFDVLWPLRDDRNQALHDKMASTFVIAAKHGR